MDGKKLEPKRILNPGKKPEWNSYKSDIASLRLSKQELAKKLASRQSHNLALARAELIDKQKYTSNAATFSPSHSSKLRASANKSIDEVIAEADAALVLAEKVKEESPIMSRRSYSSLSDLPPNVPYGNPDDRHEFKNFTSPYTTEGNLFRAQGIKESSVVPKTIDPSLKTSLDPYPLTPQGWANLGGTIQLVVKTCEALWQQLEEERDRRESLHDQLQEQRRVIATLTTELMQIREDQVAVLQELQTARAYDASFMRNRSFDPIQPPALPPRGQPRSLAYSDTSLDSNDFSRRYFPTAVPDITPRSRNVYLPMPRMHRGLGYGGKAKSASQIDLHEAQSLYGDRYSNPIFQNFGYR